MTTWDRVREATGEKHARKKTTEGWKQQLQVNVTNLLLFATLNIITSNTARSTPATSTSALNQRQIQQEIIINKPWKMVVQCVYIFVFKFN